MKGSIILPTHGRQTTLKLTIESLLAVDPSAADVEIVVVDNNSDEVMSDDLVAYCARVGDPVRYLIERAPGLGAARHGGVRSARGDILIFVDDDVEVSAGWLSALLDGFRDPGVGIAGGPSVPRFTGSVPAWFWEFIGPTPFGGWWCGWLSLIDIGRSIDDIDSDLIWGLNFGIRRTALAQLRGMHPDIVPPALQRWQGDGETGLTRKAKASGVRAAYLHDALVYHSIGPDRLTAEYFAKRAYYQGVCDSFSSIRAGAEPSLTPQAPDTAPSRNPGLKGWTPEADEIRARTIVAYNDGWVFHQREAALDAVLLQWIRRNDYWDADIRQEVQKRSGLSLVSNVLTSALA